MSVISPIPDEKSLMYTTHQPGMSGLYKTETGWHTPPSVDGGMSRNHSISSNMAMLGVDERADAAAGGELYSATMPWTPPNDLVSAAPYAESPLAAPMPSHARSASYDLTMSTSVSWPDPAAAAEYYAYSQSQMPTPASMASNYFPSPSATPNLRPTAGKNRSSSASSGHHASCTCFTVCLQSLQALHNASSPASPPFDLVLSLNRKAVEGCAAMLACNRCMSRSGTHTATMLLATVIGKITSFYKNASQSYFETAGAGGSNMSAASPASAASGLGVSLGVYQINGEDGRWIELEILKRELRKLEEVYARFREVCAELSEDPEMSRAMIGYLGHTLGSTLEVVTHRKGDMGYAV